ncbi:MAG TPA: bifunctional oligoribonuclease/PAP phosphatase NrnA [Deltaproteobacteria bacterium]|nr:bifunctional oligoribonuclease/PAP phosphatase NrnA [Deltaproteobacteria bacterium]
MEVIRRGGRFLVTSHVSPEGDALGSLFGLTAALREGGFHVTAYLEDPVPEVYRFLPGADGVVHELSGLGPFDATFAVDCGAKERIGELFCAFDGAGTLVNLDHHAGNDRFGDINVVVPGASSAGEVVYDLIRAASLPLSRDTAVNLYVAILTDTGSFRYSSSTPEAFGKAGELVALGASPWDVSVRVYESQPLKKYKLLARALDTLELVDEPPFSSRVASLYVTLDALAELGADAELTDGFVNYARGLAGVEVGVFFREARPGLFKISMRSKGAVDVSAVAGRFGGGGHRNAAGCFIDGDVEGVRKRLFGALAAAFEEPAYAGRERRGGR